MSGAHTAMFRGRLLRRDDDGFEQARLAAMWNGRTTTRMPAAILLAADEHDVSAGMRLAAREGWRVSVRSGGHSWVATGVRDDALLIDLSALDAIDLDVPNRRARVQPGVEGSRLNRLLAAERLVFPTGHCPSVGIGGFLLGGGYGWNSRKLGPAALSVEAVDVVLSDGTLVHADDETHPELMWAARGAGPGFFGVVVRFHLRVYPAYDQVLRSVMVFPEEMRDEVLAWSYDVLPATSRSLEIAGKVAHSPGRERPTTTLVGVGFCADETAAEIFAPLESAPFRKHALRSVDRAPTDLAGLYAASEEFMPQGRRYAVDGVWTSASAAEILAAGREILGTVPTPESFLFWMLWGQYPTQENACWSTQGQLYFSPNSVWTAQEDDLRMELWAHSALDAFAAIDLGTQFSDANPADRPSRGMAAAQAARLEQLRATYDPDGRMMSYLTPAESTTALGRHRQTR
ncbi:FAD-binding oxidoreductase [Actinophytocola sp.]|uniref:FAD-binding oxidoreductase n=1 Tax=Actinophytocola sp. TaxID=1872138 RepID=UPI00389A51FF